MAEQPPRKRLKFFQPLNIPQEMLLQETDSYHARNVFKWKKYVKPIKYICTCQQETSPVYKKYIGDLSSRIHKTMISLLDSSDVEFAMVYEKFKLAYTFITPPANSQDSMFAMIVKPKFGNNLPECRAPIVMCSRLYEYSMQHPSSEIDLKEMLSTQVLIYCDICYKDILQPFPNSFKIGRLLITPTACILKEKRKPFVNQNNSLTYYTSVKMEEGTEFECSDEKRQCFERWCKHKNELFQVGALTFKATGETIYLNLRNCLASCFKKDATEHHYKSHHKKYTDDISTGNITSAFGKISFKVVSSFSDVTNDYASKIAANTKQKGNGFLRLSSSYLPAAQSQRFIVMKMVPQHSRDIEVRKIDDCELGIIAIPDTTDGNCCGLKLEMVPGTRVSNRTTCSTTILLEFAKRFKPSILSTSKLYLGGDNCEEMIFEGVDIASVFKTVCQLRDDGFDFDFEMVPHNQNDFVGVLFSYHGMPIEHTTGFSICTIQWAIKNNLLTYKPNLLSAAGEFIDFFNFDNNSKMVGYLRSKPQEIDYYWHPDAQQLMSQSHRIVLSYPQQNILNKYDSYVGQTVLVGVGSWHGMNVEESILICKSAAERGVFMAEETRRLAFIFQGMKYREIEVTNVNRRRLETNSIMFEVIGVEAYDQFCSFVRGEKRQNGFMFFFNDDFDGKKWRIKNTELLEINGYIRLIVEIISINYCNEGIKLSTVHGQKGIVNRLVNAEDMPFTSHDMTLDMLINVSMIKRLTVGQDMQGRATTSRIRSQKLIESQPTADMVKLFCGNDMLLDDSEIESILPDMTDIYDPLTGEKLATIELLFVYYRKLRQEPDQTAQCTSLGSQEKRDLSTEQFQKGKANRGGITFATMELKNIQGCQSRAFLEDLNVNTAGAFKNVNDPLLGVVPKTAAAINTILTPLGYKLQFSDKRKR